MCLDMYALFCPMILLKRFPSDSYLDNLTMSTRHVWSQNWSCSAFVVSVAPGYGELLAEPQRHNVVLTSWAQEDLNGVSSLDTTGHDGFPFSFRKHEKPLASLVMRSKIADRLQKPLHLSRDQR